METIVTTQLMKRSDFQKVGPISLRVRPGEILGIIGPERSGKTALLRLLWGFARPDHGSVLVFGLQPHLNQLKVRLRAGFVFKDAPFYEGMSAPAFLEFIGGFYENWDRSRVADLMDRFNIPADNTPMYHASPGNRMKTALVAAIGHNPSLLILDDPVYEVHPMVRAEILRFLKELANENNVSIVISSKSVQELDQVIDNTLVLKA